MLPIQKLFINYNRSPRNEKPKFLIIHDVGEPSSAKNNRDYFAGGNRNASADFFVDSDNIIQIIDYNNYYSWAIGDGRGKYGKTNGNSLSIEMCLESNYQPSEKTIQNTLELTRHLMNELNISVDNVLTHHQCSDKKCPLSFSANNWAKWNEFKTRLSGQTVSTSTTSTESIITPKTVKLQQQIESLIYWLNIDYSAKIPVRPNGAYVESELFSNIETVGKLITLGHKSHLVEWIQQKLEMYGYLKTGSYTPMLFDLVVQGAITELQKNWGRITDGKFLISTQTAQIFLENE